MARDARVCRNAIARHPQGRDASLASPAPGFAGTTSDAIAGAPHAPFPLPFPRDTALAKPNYNFEKRQREIAKKKQKDEKMAKKRAARESDKPAGTDADTDTSHDSAADPQQ